MTMIMLDPPELTAAGAVLRNLSIEVADIGTQLASCINCAMDARLEPMLDQLVATADAVMDDVAAQLYNESVDVSQRAFLAQRDVLTAATVTGAIAATSPVAGSFVGGHTTPAFTITGGVSPGPMIIGGTTSRGFGGGTGAGSFVGGGTAGSMAAFNIANDAHNRAINVILEPSRSSLQNKLGRSMSPTEYVNRGYRGLNE